MYIKSLKIENFRCVEKLEVDFSRSTNVFCGVNGAGKTTVLDALNVLFSWFVARLNNARGAGERLRDEDIRNGAEECFLEVTLVTLGNDVVWSLSKQHSKSRKTASRKSDLRNLMEWVNQIVEDARSEGNCPVPVFTYFDVHHSRTVLRLPKRIHRKHALDKFDIYAKKADRIHTPYAFFNWFREREDIENEKYRYASSRYRDHQLEAVRRATDTLVAGYRQLRMERPRGFVVNKEGQKFLFEQLSDGEKAYIMLVAEIARLLAMANPNPNQNPLEAEGVILIDEIDLHMHPSWQSEILPQLRTCFPNCQFLVTTHSPFVLSSVDLEGYLYLMREYRAQLVEGGVTGAEVSHILLDTLGVPALRARVVDVRINDIWRRLERGDPDDEALLREIETLRGIIDPNDHVFARFALERARLRMRKSKLL